MSTYTALFKKWTDGKRRHIERKTLLITTVHKKQNKGCDNDRRITVTCTVSRIFRKILITKIGKQYCDIKTKEQAGFRAGRSTVDQLFCVTQFIEKKDGLQPENILNIHWSKKLTTHLTYRKVSYGTQLKKPT